MRRRARTNRCAHSFSRPGVDLRLVNSNPRETRASRALSSSTTASRLRSRCTADAPLVAVQLDAHAPRTTGCARLRSAHLRPASVANVHGHSRRQSARFVSLELGGQPSRTRLCRPTGAAYCPRHDWTRSVSEAGCADCRARCVAPRRFGDCAVGQQSREAVSRPALTATLTAASVARGTGHCRRRSVGDGGGEEEEELVVRVR